MDVERLMTTSRHRISNAILHRYDVPVPRYTSYPPATDLAPVTPATVLEIYQGAVAQSRDAPLSIYVHLPFCKTMCRYCGCAVLVSKSGRSWDAYLETLLREIDLVAEHVGARTVQQLHWGGGSPSWLPPADAERLFAHLGAAFPLSADAEVAIEIDPQTLRPGQLAQLRGLGFNRLSVGVQDLDPRVQEAVARVYPEATVETIVEDARALSFDSVNLDLMYGLPHQSPASFANTVETVINWRPDRLAVFGYAHVPWIRPHQRLLPVSALPTAATRIELFATAADLLAEHGYQHLGLDHFVLPTDELAVAKRTGKLTRNFQGYSVQRSKDLVGIGMTAIGDIGGAYLANHRSLQRHRACVMASELPVERGLRRTPREEVIRAAIIKLMCHDTVDLEAVVSGVDTAPNIFGSGVTERLDALAADGIIERSGWRVRVTAMGRFFLRHVAGAVDPAFGSATDTGPRFSQAL